MSAPEVIAVSFFQCQMLFISQTKQNNLRELRKVSKNRSTAHRRPCLSLHGEEQTLLNSLTSGAFQTPALVLAGSLALLLNAHFLLVSHVYWLEAS